MTFEADCLNSVLIESNESLADAISRPSTSADNVAIRPVTSLTMSFDASLRWLSDATLRSHIPASAPPKTHTNVIDATANALMVHLRSPVR